MFWRDRENIPEVSAQKICAEIVEATGIEPITFAQSHGDVVTVPAGWRLCDVCFICCTNFVCFLSSRFASQAGSTLCQTQGFASNLPLTQ